MNMGVWSDSQLIPGTPHQPGLMNLGFHLLQPLEETYIFSSDRFPLKPGENRKHLFQQVEPLEKKCPVVIDSL